MQKSFGQSDPKMIDYFERTFEIEDAALSEIRKRAEQKGLPSIHVAKYDGRHLTVLTQMAGASRIVEIGTLAGYSTLCLARGLNRAGAKPPRIHTFEFDGLHAAIAQETFRLNRIEDVVTLHIGAALDHLAEIERDGPFDLVFIDADKVSYPDYLHWAKKNLRVGGTIIGDNTFAWDMIADTTFEAADDERAVQALRKFNSGLAQDPNFVSTMLPTSEGLTLGVKIK